MAEHLSTSFLTEACEMGLCGNCYKGQDQEGGWCKCACHPVPSLGNVLWDFLMAWFATIGYLTVAIVVGGAVVMLLCQCAGVHVHWRYAWPLTWEFCLGLVLIFITRRSRRERA